MGLASDGDHGVKALVKNVYKGAARTFTSLGDVRRAVKADRQHTAVALDGNVLMMQCPQSAASFAAYTGVVSSAIRTAMGSAGIVVVVFDDPKHLTAAKREEQMRRDARRTKVEPVCSTDIFPHPTDDNYGLAELTATADCHALVKCRAARNRFFDETGRQVLLNLQKSIAKWAGGGDEAVVIFDGLDPRGANRPIGAPRETQIFGSNDEVAALFQRDTPIGEGDLKLAWVEERVRQLTAAGQLAMQLHLTVTIDSDSIAIELLEQARRNCLPPLDHELKGALCMRERNMGKRGSSDNEEPSATYFVVDYSNLLEILMAHMWGVPRTRLDLLPSPEKQREATALMCAGWALAGCDFVKLAGLKASMVMETLPSMLKASPELVHRFSSAWSDDRDAVKQVTPVLRRLVLLCAGNYADQPRARKATVETMRNHDELTLKRAAWVMSYWSMHEFAGDLSDFGFTPLSDAPEPAALGVAPAGSPWAATPPKAPKAPKAGKAAEPPPPILCSDDMDVGAPSSEPHVRSKYFPKEMRPGDSKETAVDVDASAFEAFAWGGAVSR